MTFRDLLEKYKNGTATPEEIALVEEELEKNELINDYLSAQLFASAPEPLPVDNIQIKKVRSSVRREFWKMTALCCAILILLGAVVKMVVLPAYNNRFYNPAAAFEHGPEYITPFKVDINIFSNLHCPGWGVVSAYAEPLGFGEYDVNLSFFNLYHDQQSHRLRVTRGKVDYPRYTIPFHMPTAGAFYDRGSQNVYYIDENGRETTCQNPEDLQYYLDEIAQLPKNSRISAYISFTEDFSLAQLVNLKKSFPELSFRWAAVRATDDEYFHNDIGFPIDSGGISFEDISSLSDYPCLDLHSFSWEKTAPRQQAEMLESYFTSMVKYMSTRQEFLTAFCDFNGFDAQLYTEVLQYVEENGVKVYGLLIDGSPEDILSFAKLPTTNSLMVTDAKFSVLG